MKPGPDGLPCIHSLHRYDTEALDLVARYHVYLFLKARILLYNVTLASSAYPETPNERCTRTPY